MFLISPVHMRDTFEIPSVNTVCLQHNQDENSTFFTNMLLEACQLERHRDFIPSGLASELDIGSWFTIVAHQDPDHNS
jgi:hypothetical protein